MLCRLNTQPGDGIPWRGEVVATVDGEGHWSVHQPDAPEEASYVQGYLNARYGPSRLITYCSVSALIEAAVGELDGEILQSPPS